MINEVYSYLYISNYSRISRTPYKRNKEHDERITAEQDLTSPPKDCIYFSCPSYVMPWANAKAMVQIKASDELPALQLLRCTAIYSALSLMRASEYIQSFWDPQAYERRNLYYRMLSFNDLPKHQLYLYSKGDTLCGYETIEQFHEEQSKRGNDVNFICFEDSAHVDHGRKYQERYQSAIIKFCRTTLSNFGKPVNREESEPLISKI